MDRLWPEGSGHGCKSIAAGSGAGQVLVKV